MSGRPSPTVRSKRLRRELRRLREERELTIEQVADLAGGEWNPSTLGRWEKGDRRIRPADLRHLLDVYDVHGEQREALITLAREARQRGWWQVYADVLPSEYSTYIGLETEAREMRTYQQQLIPGILQTAEYARAVIRATRPNDGPEAVERRVAVRLDRQKVLTGPQPLRLWTVIDEAAIRRVVGSRQIMREQLDQLADMAERPGVQLQVLPFEAGAHASMATSFVVLGFGASDPNVVYLDTGMSALFVEAPEDVAGYTLVFDHLRAAADSPRDSARVFQAAAQDLA
ncbi:XRE family transcriptional regulator [Actinomadura darangshiensis]|uniref:XRE family transcriptional regulator n=1 Tax=Actinomadura darangshiensis TaxID=705336 RepID=A0A4R5C2W0_9ACTN|nr:helix-turn-helix transcriptional regulator [Actinomadura darangshiensis]TDD91112.1 XRE family transcriptional regulator [Actinomadura darangshiensis]